jgi:hypothetical protein
MTAKVLLLVWLFLAQSVLDDRDMMSLVRHLSFNPSAWFTAANQHWKWPLEQPHGQNRKF